MTFINLFSLTYSRVTLKISAIKIFAPKKFPQENKKDPQNTHRKKYWTYKLHTRKNFGSLKYPRENTLVAQNNHEKTYWIYKYPRQKILDQENTQDSEFWTHKLPTRRIFGFMKYLKEKILDPPNNHDKKFRTHQGIMERWHETYFLSQEISMRDLWKLICIDQSRFCNFSHLQKLKNV